MLEHTVAIIIAGGSGTRFWPMSTPERPKQFIRLFGERSMLQMTFDRLAGLVPPERTIVLTAQKHVPLVEEHLPELPRQNVIGEPLPRDTAGAVALATAIVRARFGNATMLVLPADHLISPVDQFQGVLRSAVEAARRAECLYTFGIVPDFPSTGYGYLEQGEPLDSPDAFEHFRLRNFKEKPDADTAERFLSQGGFYWNSGMFAWQADTIWQEIEEHLPRFAASLGDVVQHDGQEDWPSRLKKALQPLPKVSIDVGVMEKARDVRMVKAEFQWSDVGGWLAVEKFFAPEHPNLGGRGRLHTFDAENCFSLCEDGDEVVACVGVHDLVVIRSEHRTLVAHKSYVEKMKSFIEQLNAKEQELLREG